MLKNLDSEFVIRLVDAYEGRSEVILVTEYLAGGELFERVVDEDFDLTESHCVLFVRQICQGVSKDNIYRRYEIDRYSTYSIKKMLPPMPANVY